MGSASSSPYSGLAGADSGYSAGLENEDQRIVDRCASLAVTLCQERSDVRAWWHLSNGLPGVVPHASHIDAEACPIPGSCSVMTEAEACQSAGS